MKKEKTVKISNVIMIVTTTALVMTLIFSHILKKKEERWFKIRNVQEETRTIKYKSITFDSIYLIEDTTFYYKNDSLVGTSIKTKK
jgi:hypothetical protein